jgi:hypothetical protein
LLADFRSGVFSGLRTNLTETSERASTLTAKTPSQNIGSRSEVSLWQPEWWHDLRGNLLRLKHWRSWRPGGKWSDDRVKLNANAKGFARSDLAGGAQVTAALDSPTEPPAVCRDCRRCRYRCRRSRVVIEASVSSRVWLGNSRGVHGDWRASRRNSATRAARRDCARN